MGMLLHSGISTAEGLHILCDESKTDADRQILTPLIRSVEENGSLSRALDESGVFPSSMTAYVRTGEETGCWMRSWKVSVPTMNRRKKSPDRYGLQSFTRCSCFGMMAVVSPGPSDKSPAGISTGI